ncbi:hypothetical protein ACFL1M_03840 [Patescibacteria group bacterium]
MTALYILFIIGLLIERSLGFNYLLIPVLSGILFLMSEEDMPKMMVIMGVVVDWFFGTRFGMSSLFFLIAALQVSMYRAQLEGNNAWSMFLVTLLLSVEGSLVWSTPLDVPDHFAAGLVSLGLWWTLSWWSKRGMGADVYLRR